MRYFVALLHSRSVHCALGDVARHDATVSPCFDAACDLVTATHRSAIYGLCLHCILFSSSPPALHTLGHTMRIAFLPIAFSFLLHPPPDRRQRAPASNKCIISVRLPCCGRHHRAFAPGSLNINCKTCSSMRCSSGLENKPWLWALRPRPAAHYHGRCLRQDASLQGSGAAQSAAFVLTHVGNAFSSTRQPHLRKRQRGSGTLAL